jgi:NADH dehydrogenase/NADH:ubiquinone oxidoreductase subunit G
MAVEAADDAMPIEEDEVAADMIPARPVPGLEPPMAPPVPQRGFGQDPDGTTVAMNITDNTLVLVDGIKQPKGAPVKLPVGREIASVNVLKGKEGKKKYGKEAKDGAIEITTAKKRADKVSVNRINVPGSAAFAFSMPDGDVSGDIIEFHGAFPEGLEAFADLGQLDFSELEKLGDLKIFSDIESMSNDDINAWAAHASRLAERAGRQAELAARRAEIAGRKAIIIDKRADRENRNADNATLRKQLEEAKKQLEETKKELKKQIAKQKAAAGKKA